MNSLESAHDEATQTVDAASSKAGLHLGRYAPAFLRNGWTVFLRMVEKVSVKAKMAWVLFCVMILPTAVILYLVESHASRDTALYLAAYLALSLALLGPLAGFFSRFLVIKDIREINAFCMEVKRGNSAVRFDLPVEERLSSLVFTERSGVKIQCSDLLWRYLHPSKYYALFL